MCAFDGPQHVITDAGHAAPRSRRRPASAAPRSFARSFRRASPASRRRDRRGAPVSWIRCSTIQRRSKPSRPRLGSVERQSSARRHRSPRPGRGTRRRPAATVSSGPGAILLRALADRAAEHVPSIHRHSTLRQVIDDAEQRDQLAVRASSARPRRTRRRPCGSPRRAGTASQRSSCSRSSGSTVREVDLGVVVVIVDALDLVLRGGATARGWA